MSAMQATSETLGEFAMAVNDAADAAGLYHGVMVDSDHQAGEQPIFSVGWHTRAGALWAMRLYATVMNGDRVLPPKPAGLSDSDAEAVQRHLLQSLACGLH